MDRARFGHVMGLGIPQSWTDTVGISEDMYHFLAVSVGFRSIFYAPPVTLREMV